MQQPLSPMRSKRKNTKTPARTAVFLDALAEGLSVSSAAKAAGVPLRTIYGWREADPAFAAEWTAAYTIGADNLEAEAQRRAVKGIEEPVFHGGKVVGSVRRYSDTLLIYMLKARDPERFCDRARTAALMRKWAKQENDEGRSAAETVVSADILEALNLVRARKAALAD